MDSIEHENINFDFLERRVASTAGVDRGYALIDLADAFYGSRQFPHAFAALTAAVDLFADAGGEAEAVAHCKRKAGCALAELERWEEAIASMEEAKALYAQLDLPLYVAKVERLLGSFHVAISRFDEALGNFQSAKLAFREEGVTDEAAFCAIDAAQIYTMLQDFDCALIELQIAEKLLKSAGNSESVADSAFDMAELYYSLGHFQEAARAYRLAKRVNRAIGADHLIFHCDVGIAECKEKLKK